MLGAAAASVKKSIAAMEQLLTSGLEDVVDSVEVITSSFSDGKKLLCFGNGGSAADAQHFAAELVNRFQLERPGLPGIALTTDSSVITAIGNDYDFDQLFSKQIKALGATGDIAFGISTSGSSPNVLEGFRAARSRGMVTIGLASPKAVSMAQLCDVFIAAPADETPRIQELHSLIIHLICELVDLKLFGRSR